MRQDHQRLGQKAQPLSAATVATDARWMLEQLSFPIDARDTIKARRERAIRRAGLSPAKGMRLWYRQGCEILAHEYLTLAEAYKNHVRVTERKLESDLAELRALRAAREMRDRHGALDLPTPARGVAARENAIADLAGAETG